MEYLYILYVTQSVEVLLKTSHRQPSVEGNFVLFAFTFAVCGETVMITFVL